jgi:hypothetical protein
LKEQLLIDHQGAGLNSCGQFCLLKRPPEAARAKTRRFPHNLHEMGVGGPLARDGAPVRDPLRLA